MLPLVAAEDIRAVGGTLIGKDYEVLDQGDRGEGGVLHVDLQFLYLHFSISVRRELYALC